MKATYRGQHEIVFAILQACDKPEGSLQTRIMNDAYLSLAQLRSYMGRMLDYGLLVEIERRYHVTGKGRRAIELFQELDGILRV